LYINYRLVNRITYQGERRERWFVSHFEISHPKLVMALVKHFYPLSQDGRRRPFLDIFQH